MSNALGAVVSTTALLLLAVVAAGPSFGWFELSSQTLAALAAAKLVAGLGLVASLARQFGVTGTKLVALLLGAGVLVAAGLMALLPKAPSALPPAEQLYVNHCGACHGNLGQGSDLGPPLNDSQWIHGTGSLDDISAVVDDGVPGTTMVGWKDILSDEDRLALSVYVFGLQLAEQ